MNVSIDRWRLRSLQCTPLQIFHHQESIVACWVMDHKARRSKSEYFLFLSDLNFILTFLHFSSTLSRLFNSSRTSEDSGSHNGNGTWHQHSHSYSSSTNSQIPSINTGSSLNISDGGVPQHSRDSGLQCEDWIDGRLDGGPPGPVPLSGTSTLPRGSNTNTPSSANASWTGGSEFTPSSLFPYSHSRSKSGESSLQEVKTSMSTRASADGTVSDVTSNFFLLLLFLNCYHLV